jgi:hypothetical protein
MIAPDLLAAVGPLLDLLQELGVCEGAGRDREAGVGISRTAPASSPFPTFSFGP